MPTQGKWTRGAILAGAIAAIAAPGCYTRLTTPKEAINYRFADGSVIQSQVARAILAPEYNRALDLLTADGKPEDAAYRLQPGTRIRVEVWGHGIQSTVNIRPDGFIDLPLIGDVAAEGRIIADLKKEISDRYKEFYIDPPQIVLNTDVTQEQDVVRAGEVSVINPSGRQGVVTLTGDEYLSQVLAQINALHPKSEWNEIAVIRRARTTNERYIVIADLEELLRSGDLAQDVKMRNGDIVFIPTEKNTLLEEFFATFAVTAGLISDADTITAYIERVEGY